MKRFCTFLLLSSLFAFTVFPPHRDRGYSWVWNLNSSVDFTLLPMEWLATLLFVSLIAVIWNPIHRWIAYIRIWLR